MRLPTNAIKKTPLLRTVAFFIRKNRESKAQSKSKNQNAEITKEGFDFNFNANQAH